MRKKGKILIVDDEEIMRSSLADWLREDGYETTAVDSGKKAIEEVKKEKFSAALVDLKMPEMDGIQTMREIKKIQKNLPIIIITAYATVDTAVQAIKEGAYDYLPKPFNPDEITLLIKKIIEHQKLLDENILLRKELKKSFQFQDIIGKSNKMREIFEFIKSISNTKSTILISGETGTGKELVARAIHNLSRKKGPFVPISCAALPESLLEAELFGYEKGAFTDAKERKLGKIELADGGTLFLDEIGDISPKTQVDLLRFLQEKDFRRIGGQNLIKVDVRVIAATNKDLKKLVEEGKFREDLYYRLNVINISLPPLRERKEDIPLLASHFLEKYNIENNKQIERISEDVMNILTEYNWPGNVRELENIIERAVVVCKSNLITLNDLPEYIKEKEIKTLKEDMTLEELEKNYIERILKKYNFNIQKCADILGIDRATLYRKIEKYKISKE
jgi:DNA-binding NtrC family response regulator